MANKNWRGDAPEVCQVWHVKFPDVHPGRTYALKIGNKSLSAAAGETAASLIQALIAEINATDFPEWGEVVPSSDQDENGDDVLVLTASRCGRPVAVEVDTEASDLTRIEIVETAVGAAGRNEVQKIAFVKAPTGGTFTISWDPGTGAETTGAIDHDATAAAVQAALEGLASVAPGDVLVSGGPGPGAPWIVQFAGTYAETDVNLMSVDGTNLTGAGHVEVETVTEGVGLSDAIHAVRISAFDAHPDEATLTYYGEAITWNPQNGAAGLQSALEGGFFGEGNVEVLEDHQSVEPVDTGSYSTSGSFAAVYLIHFRGDWGGRFVKEPDEFTSSLGHVDVGVLHAGGASAWDEWQWLDLPLNSDFLVHYDGAQSDFVDHVQWYGQFGSDPLKAALDSLSTVTFNVVVHDVFLIDRRASLVALQLQGQTDREPIVCFPGTSGTFQDGHSGGGTDEVQSVTVFATGGTFTLTFEGETTAALAWNETAANVEAALEALSVIDDVAVTGSGTPADPYLVKFLDALGAPDVSPMTADASSLTGGGAEVTVIETAAAPVDEQQTVALDAGVSGGDFTLSFEGEQTAAIAQNATAATVEAALEALSTVDGVSVAGVAGGPWTVTFDTGNVAGRDVPLLKADPENLAGGSSGVTLTEETASRGPHHWDDPLNWDPEGVPATGDDVRVEVPVSILYGLDQSAVQLNSLIVADTFTEQIGLPVINEDGDYYEYRERALKIGLQGDAQFVVGGPEGSGPGLARFDFGAGAVSPRIRSTGGSIETGRPAVTAIGTAIGTVTVITGHFGLAVFPFEAATAAKLVVRGGEVEVGRGVTLSALDKTGGLLQVDEATLNGTAIIE